MGRPRVDNFGKSMLSVPEGGSGIYAIRNVANNSVYIGTTDALHSRLLAHLGKLSRNKHHNKALQSDWNVYGEQAFVIEILEVTTSCPPAGLEQEWIKKLARRTKLYNTSYRI